MFVLPVLEAPNTKTNSLCVQTHLAIKLFLILSLNIWEGIIVKGVRYIYWFAYTSLSLEVPPKTFKDLDQILYNFIWRKKTHKKGGNL